MASSPIPQPARPDDRCGLLPLLAIIALLTAWRALAIAASGLDLYVDEAQYWDWSRHLAWGYFSKPPVLPVLIKVSTAVGGDGAGRRIGVAVAVGIGVARDVKPMSAPAFTIMW